MLWGPMMAAVGEGSWTSMRSTLEALVVVAAIFAAIVLAPRFMPARASALVGRDAPDFQLAAVANAGGGGAESGTVHLHALRGHLVLLDFWATWCTPCREEAPVVEALSRRWHDQGLVVVGVNTDSPGQGDPAAYADAHGLTYPIVRDLEGDASRLFGVAMLPTLVLVSPDGRVAAVRTGLTAGVELDALVRRSL